MELRFFVEPSRDEETDFLEFHLVRLMLAGTFLLDIRHALAAGAVLDYFNDFMDGLCTGFYTDADGFWDYGIDLSMKSFMQAKLLRAMLRFKP